VEGLQALAHYLSEAGTKTPRSTYDPPGTPLLPDPQEDEWADDDDEDGDEPEDVSCQLRACGIEVP
jgi:hypothetical protein